jgi:uncharacterized protein HemX
VPLHGRNFGDFSRNKEILSRPKQRCIRPLSAVSSADEGVTMKKLLIVLALAGLGYGAYYFLMQVKDKTEQRQGDWKTEKKLEKELGPEENK